MWIGPGPHQSRHHIDMSGLGREVQSREAVMAGGFEIVAGLESYAKNIQIAGTRGPKQRGFALWCRVAAEQSPQQGDSQPCPEAVKGRLSSARMG